MVYGTQRYDDKHIKQGLGLRLWFALVVGALAGLLGGFLTVAEPSHAAVTISFGGSTLQNETSTRPTSLQFGPDGKLYVAQQNGLIKIYTLKRNSANNYAVTATETITKIRRIPNHNDNGTLNTGVTDRLVTGGNSVAPRSFAPRVNGGATMPPSMPCEPSAATISG